jgi:hypothetical protein
MPAPHQILEQLTRLATEGRMLGLIWHLALLVGLALVVAKKWESRASLAVAAVFPMFTASLVAFAVGNWVNGLVLDLGALTMVVISRKFTGTPIEIGRPIPFTVGVATMLYAVFYTHFTSIHSWTDVWMTPIGVLPCPTMALVIGLGLMAGGFRSRAWSLTAAVLGLGYSLFGVFVLKVQWDLGLFAASVVMGLQGLLLTPPVTRKILISRHPPARPTTGAAGTA